MDFDKSKASIMITRLFIGSRILVESFKIFGSLLLPITSDFSGWIEMLIKFFNFVMVIPLFFNPLRKDNKIFFRQQTEELSLGKSSI